MVEQQYKVAAAEGAVYELKMRLLADKIPELQQAAYDRNLADVEKLIIKYFDGSLNTDEKSTLELSRELRNKVLHCDFRAARDKLTSLGVETRRGNVKRAEISAPSSAEMAEKIGAVITNTPSTFEYVADTKAQPGAVFGWLLELGVSGDFKRAAECFARAAAIVERLAMIG
jgi:hypothetical protein